MKRILTCRHCGREFATRLAVRSPEVCSRAACQQRRKRLRSYGLTLAAFQHLVDLQEGKCALCGKPFSKRGGMDASVDHCHATGKVRGLLHRTCNASIGGLGDTVEGVMAAANYLARAEMDLRDLCQAG